MNYENTINLLEEFDRIKLLNKELYTALKEAYLYVIIAGSPHSKKIKRLCDNVLSKVEAK
jgi:hypothetical protein